MRWSLLISLAIHVCILLAAVVVLPSPDEYKVDEPESLPVDIVTLEEFSKRQIQEKKKPEPKPEPEKPAAPKVKVVPEIKKIAPKISEEVKQAAKEPQPQPELKPALEPVAEQPPEPEPLEELIKQTEDVLPEPEPEPEVKKQASAPVPVPRLKPKPPVRKVAKKKKKKKKKPEFNTDDVAALLNKIDDIRSAPVSSTLDGAPKTGDIASLLGEDDRISADELDWLRQRIGRCWNVPAGARDAHNLIVKIQIQMDPLGNVIGQPRVINNSNHPCVRCSST